MTAKPMLGTYLNEHLAGARGAVDLLGKAADNNTGSPAGDFLAELLVAVDEDRASLEQLMERLDVDRSEMKQAAGRVVERLSRLRFHERVTGDPGLSLLLELEAVTMGVSAKLSLWQSVEELAILDDRIAGFDVGTLIARAHVQLADLERQRRRIAAAALSPELSDGT